MPYLVYDVGGTTMRAGLYEPGQGALLRWTRGETPSFLTAPSASFEQLRETLLQSMSNLARKLEPDRIDAVGVAFAGPIDASGRVVAAPTIWGDKQREPQRLSKDMQARLGSDRVQILNDVTAAGFRYLRSRDDDFCIVTVSSGIGNKVFSGGKPLLGPRGAGGELGHLRVDDSPDAPLCDCGGRGHLGAIASGRGAVALAQSRGFPVTDARQLAAAFHRREPWAVEVIDDCARPLGWALAAVHLGLGIERFVLVGGFALALGDEYRRAVEQAAAARCWNWSGSIELGIDDDLSGLIGAGIAVDRGETR